MIFLKIFFDEILFVVVDVLSKKNATTQGLAATSAFDDEPAYMVKFIEMVWVVQKIGKLS